MHEFLSRGSKTDVNTIKFRNKAKDVILFVCDSSKCSKKPWQKKYEVSHCGGAGLRKHAKTDVNFKINSSFLVIF